MSNEPKWMADLRRQAERRIDPWVVLEGREAVEGALGGWWDVVGVVADEESDWQPPAWSGLEVRRIASGEMRTFPNAGEHDGVLGLARQPDETWNVAGLMPELEVDAALVVCPRIDDPGVVGAVIRNAATIGAKAVIFGREGASPFAAIAMRQAGGALFQVPVRVADNGQVLRSLRAGGFQLIGTGWEKGGPDLPASEIVAGRIALVLGDPNSGAGPFWCRACDQHVGIPPESRDIAATCALMLWEIDRLRQEMKDA